MSGEGGDHRQKGGVEQETGRAEYAVHQLRMFCTVSHWTFAEGLMHHPGPSAIPACGGGNRVKGENP